MEFDLPAELEAHEPPELRGVRRDHVRLLVLPRFEGPAVHKRFEDIGAFLRSGDLLVINTSRTLPALLNACDEQGQELEVRLARRRSEDEWDALLLRGRTHVGRAGMRLAFGENMSAEVIAPNPELPFLWVVHFDRCCAELLDLIYRLGTPIHYGYVAGALPLDLYQTVYAAEPGSVEMASAGRPFTWELLLKLQRQGVGIAPLLLHTGLSATRDEAIDATRPNYPEEYSIPAATAQEINECRSRGGRVVAVGTTVVRALETTAGPDGTLTASHGWTSLHISANHTLRTVDALLTGLHEPESSHLDLLSALVQPERLKQAYMEAIERRYLWHEFGDMNLII
jgi:S-adenosylmethionine:tRNA ribosyltransferase-isomerase